MVEAPTIDAVTRKANLGRVDRIPLGQGLTFLVGDVEVAVFRQRDGQLFATQSRCPHRQGPLADGVVGAGAVVCPLHAKKFDLKTGHCSEKTLCVKTYAIHEDAGNIVMTLDSELKPSPLETMNATF